MSSLVSPISLLVPWMEQSTVIAGH